jgi:hypothetical protein
VHEGFHTVYWSLTPTSSNLSSVSTQQFNSVSLSSNNSTIGFSMWSCNILKLMPESPYFFHRTLFQIGNVYEHSLFQCVSRIENTCLSHRSRTVHGVKQHGSWEIHMCQSIMHKLTSEHCCPQNLPLTATQYQLWTMNLLNETQH